MNQEESKSKVRKLDVFAILCGERFANKNWIFDEDLRGLVNQVRGDLRVSVSSTWYEDLTQAIKAANGSYPAIQESDLVESAKQTALSLGYVKEDELTAWPTKFIDWEAAAIELFDGWVDIEFDGNTWLWRKP